MVFSRLDQVPAIRRLNSLVNPRYNPEIGLPEYHIISMDSSYCNGILYPLP